MRYIDAFNHFFPKKIWDRIIELDGTTGRDIGKRMRGVPAIYDLDERFRVMDMFSKYDYGQVLSLGMPPIEKFGANAVEMARLGNDGLAELAQKYPERFPGFYASLPMNDPDAAVAEVHRAFRDLGANGVQIHSNVNGAPLDEPRFFPIFEAIAQHNRPVMLHPARGQEVVDYITEEKSKYEIWWTFGWPYETSAAMARMVFSGMLDRLPELKVVAHHLGAMIPYFEGRVGPGWDQLGKRTSDEDYTILLKTLKKRPLDYFKDFYADTATFGSRSAMVCGLDFYGADKVLFASDCPFDPERGPGYIRDTIAILEKLEFSDADRHKICHGNAETLLGIAAR